MGVGSRGPTEGDRPTRGMSGSASESLEAVHAFLGGERAQPLGLGCPGSVGGWDWTHAGRVGVPGAPRRAHPTRNRHPDGSLEGRYLSSLWPG